MEKEKQNIYNRILDKAIELCLIADRDKLISGNSFVEIGKRSIKVLKPSKIKLKVKVKKHNSRREVN